MLDVNLTTEVLMCWGGPLDRQFVQMNSGVAFPPAEGVDEHYCIAKFGLRDWDGEPHYVRILVHPSISSQEILDNLNVVLAAFGVLGWLC